MTPDHIGIFWVAASTGQPYAELMEERRTEQHPTGESYEALRDRLRACPYSWRPDRQNPPEAPWARIVI
jgi:hypothetical protein